ncbi:hypothetical protein M3Y96_00071800 [Aphelenchoides besseyi]|nr:hypothetical protein M3Y96_00071800 [Aphelenchoides besseyi]
MSNDSTRLQTILCGCCWPSRSKDQHLPEPHKGPDVYEFAVFKQFTNPNEQAVEIVRQPPVKPINLSANHLPRIVVTSSTSSQLTTSDDADYESLAEFVTARTSRSSHGDECRFRSMPELVEEIRSELLGRNFEDVKQEFVTFFRGEPQKSQLTSVPPKSIEDEPEVTSSVAPYPNTNRNRQTNKTHLGFRRFKECFIVLGDPPIDS